jgi:transposase
MAQNIINSSDKNINNVVETKILLEKSLNTAESKSLEKTSTTTQAAIPDPQVSSTKQISPRRTFTDREKFAILEAYEACQTIEERGKLLRKTGLYHARISYWRQLRNAGRLGNHSSKKKKVAAQSITSHKLAQENTRLKKKLLHAEAIIDLQKKVCELFGQHILPHEKSEAK